MRSISSCEKRRVLRLARLHQASPKLGLAPAAISSASVPSFSNPPPQGGAGARPVAVFWQPAGAASGAGGCGVPAAPGSLGGPGKGAGVAPPFRVNPASVSPGLTSLGLTYLPGTDHGWAGTHAAWNQGQYDNWAVQKGPMAMSYMTREDLPYHHALADAFTVGGAYFFSILRPPHPNRFYFC